MEFAVLISASGGKKLNYSGGLEGTVMVLGRWRPTALSSFCEVLCFVTLMVVFLWFLLIVCFWL